MTSAARRRSLSLAAALAVLSPIAVLAQEDLATQARSALLRAAHFWSGTVASHGGYVWEYSTDLTTRRRGESGDLPQTTNWVQAGTPMVGSALLLCYAATGDAALLEAALATGRCLAYGQLESGGWHYSIEHDPQRVKHWYHRLGEAGKALGNVTTFDDDNTQSATRFLIELDRYVDDAEISAAVARALDCFHRAQYRDGAWDGAWPQRYPPPKGTYGEFPTFNDGSMSDCVRTMLLAWDTYGRPEDEAAVRRCMEFYLRAQQPPPQAGWPQQVDRDLEPAWARRFEPPSVCGGESADNCSVLMDLAQRLNEPRCLDAVGRCVEWYRASRIGGTDERGTWARFYELKTNRPLYFTRTYELTYDDKDLPLHYSFKSNYGVNAMIRRYEALRQAGLQPAVEAQNPDQRSPEAWKAAADGLQERVKTAIETLDDQGRWVRRVPRREQTRDAQGRIGYSVDAAQPLDMMYSNTTVTNLRALANYVIASRQGPAITAPRRLPPPPPLPARD